jgi:predicted RNA binding protein YcfA (HicA-like mRNA interferase family)
MTRLPRIKGKELIRALQRVGFTIDRTHGSHVFPKHVDGRVPAVPAHAGETLVPGLLRAILRDVKMTAQTLSELLH